MGFKTTAEHESRECPGCKRRLNFQAASVENAPWQRFTLCVYCGTLLEYKNGKPAIITKEQFVLLPKQIQQNLERGQYEASKLRPAMLIAYDAQSWVTPEELE